MADNQADDAPKEKPSESKPFTAVRWWENYLVRYFVGTAVGAVIILYFADPSLALLRSSILKSGKEAGEFSSLNLVILTGMGLAYCYGASAPMLSLHAVRAHLDLIQLKPKWGFWSLTTLCAVGMWAALVFAFSFNWFSKESLSLSLFCLVATVQITLISGAHLTRYARVENFYRRLSGVRARDDRKTGEYVESYRHLREHSNAYAIIVLELILAVALAMTRRNWQRMVVLLLWLGPPAYCWLIATVLEVRFAVSPDHPTEAAHSE